MLRLAAATYFLENGREFDCGHRRVALSSDDFVRDHFGNQIGVPVDTYLAMNLSPSGLTFLASLAVQYALFDLGNHIQTLLSGAPRGSLAIDLYLPGAIKSGQVGGAG